MTSFAPFKQTTSRYAPFSATKLAHQWAEQQFEKAFKAAKHRQAWSWLTGSRSQLDQLNAYATVSEWAAPVSKTVRLANIIGSTNGNGSGLDGQFLPLSKECRARWVSIAAAIRMNHPLPPVELHQVGSRYFVIDGHLRLSVAKWLGQKELVANVTEADAFESLSFADDEWAAYIATYGFAYF